MKVRPGTRLGRYEVMSHLATGGMGEVYRARDTHLERYVALKVVAEGFEHDPTAQPRFDRELRVTTDLEHPHICRVLDAGRDDGVAYFAMELLEGESLERRLERGAIPFDQAVGYAIEIADALCYAHGHGVIHRDLKPANVFLTATGAKVLDFGLAKVRSAGQYGVATSHATIPLDIPQREDEFGSTPYMAPERFDGVDADTRSDIFSFGAVLYEMVSGRRAFAGDSAIATITAVMSTDPPPITLQHPKAHDLEWIIRRCLAKARELRWQAAADVHALLKRVAGNGFAHTPAPQRKGWFAAAAVAGAAITALAAWTLMDAPHPPAPVALSIVPPFGATFTPTPGSATTPQLALAPDGRTLAFVASGQDRTPYVWVRHLDSLAATRLDGTKNASFPFFSPDGKSLGFFADDMMRRVDLAGGPSRKITDAPNGRGASWSEDGRIIFAGDTNTALQVVSDAGGKASVVIQLDAARGEIGHRWPQFLPDGRRFIFYSRPSPDHEPDGGIYLSSLHGEKPRLVIRAGVGATLVRPDRLLVLADGSLLSYRFDASSGTVSGDALVVAENVAVSSNFYAAVTAARDGTIAFAPAAMTSDLEWTRRDGTVDRTVGGLGRYVDFHLSPKGGMLAVADVGRDSNHADIFGVDLTRGDVRTSRIASSRSMDASPVWSPDGSRVVFRSNRLGAHDLYIATATGGGGEALFQTSTLGKYPTSWSDDGTIVFHTSRPGSSTFDIMAAQADTPGNPQPLLNSDYNEIQGQISRDGKWLAYASDDTGTFQVYVKPLPDGRREPVSTTAGLDPHWSATGDELFYINLKTQRLNVVSVKRTGQGIEIGASRPLFEVRDAMIAPPYTSVYDVAPDGEHLLVRVTREDVRTTPFAVLLNWPVNRRP